LRIAESSGNGEEQTVKGRHDDYATDDVRLELERFLEDVPGRFQGCGEFGFFAIRVLFRIALKCAFFRVFLKRLIFRLSLTRNLGSALLISDGG
jgi:hypothetical protein